MTKPCCAKEPQLKNSTGQKQENTNESWLKRDRRLFYRLTNAAMDVIDSLLEDNKKKREESSTGKNNGKKKGIP